MGVLLGFEDGNCLYMWRHKESEKLVFTKWLPFRPERPSRHFSSSLYAKA